MFLQVQPSSLPSPLHFTNAEDMTLDDDGCDQRDNEQVELIGTQVSQKKKRELPVWLDRPYHVWRDQFQQDKCCPKKMVKKELMMSSCSIIFLNLGLAVLIFFGSQVFQLNNAKGDISAWDKALFCITTISTIGYGNLHPITYTEKWACIMYCVIGIPLFFMTIAVNTVLFLDFCNIVYKSFNPEVKPSTDVPWYISSVFLVIHCLVGVLIFSFWIDEMSILDSFYFSFISITTIGYGDLTPSPSTPFQYFVVASYLCIGVAIMLVFFSSLQRGVIKIHYYGRKVSGSKETEIWFGGQMMTIQQLVTLVAKRVESTPEKLRQVLHDLDRILEVACQQAEDNDPEEPCCLVQSMSVESKRSSPVPGACIKAVYLSTGSEGLDDHQATIHSFTSTNQRSISKDTERAIAALGSIQYHLKKPSVRPKSGQKTPPTPVHKILITKPSSDTTIDTKVSSLELRKLAHRVHSDGRLLVQQEV